jgi:hypothetical protein
MMADLGSKSASQPNRAPVRRGHAMGGVRTCPACAHEHPVLKTCRRCEACQVLDLTAIATEVFADLLPGGVEWRAALVRHLQNLGLNGRCDGNCPLADCRRPYFDESGLTRYRSDERSPEGSRSNARLEIGRSGRVDKEGSVT